MIPEIKTYEPPPGSYIDQACKAVVDEVFVRGEPMAMVFNGVRIVAQPDDTPQVLMERWSRIKRSLEEAESSTLHDALKELIELVRFAFGDGYASSPSHRQPHSLFRTSESAKQLAAIRERLKAGGIE